MIGERIDDAFLLLVRHLSIAFATDLDYCFGLNGGIVPDVDLYSGSDFDADLNSDFDLGTRGRRGIDGSGPKANVATDRSLYAVAWFAYPVARCQRIPDRRCRIGVGRGGVYTVEGFATQTCVRGSFRGIL